MSGRWSQMSRRIIAGAVVAVLVLLLAGAVVARSSSTISLTIADVPPGATATIAVSGPGFHESFSRSTKLTGMPVGIYRITAAQIRTGNYIYYPDVHPSQILVGPFETVDSTVDYTTVAPVTTKLVGPELAAEMTAAANDSLTFRKSAISQAITSGDVLVFGPNRVLPYGALRKVVSINDSGGAITVATRPAFLDEAFARVNFSVRERLSNPHSALKLTGSGGLTDDIRLVDSNSSAGSSDQASGGCQTPWSSTSKSQPSGSGSSPSPTPTRSATPAPSPTNATPAPAASPTPTPSSSSSSSTSGGVMSFTYSDDFSIIFNLRVDFNVFTGFHEVYFVIGLQAGANVDAKIDSALLKCDWSKTLAEKDFSNIWIWLGPFPLILTPYLSLQLAATADAGTVNLDAKAGFSGSIQAGFDWKDGQLQDLSSTTLNWSKSLTGLDEFAASDVTGGGGPQLGVKVYGGAVGSAWVGLQATAGIKLEPIAPFRWELQAAVQGDLGISGLFNNLQFDYKPGALSANWDLAKGVNFSTSDLAGGSVGTPYSQALGLQDGFPPYQPCSISAGSVPPGLSLNACTIVGTPTAAGNYQFSIRGQDSLGGIPWIGTVDRNFALTVLPASGNPAVTSPSPSPSAQAVPPTQPTVSPNLTSTLSVTTSTGLTISVLQAPNRRPADSYEGCHSCVEVDLYLAFRNVGNATLEVADSFPDASIGFNRQWELIDRRTGQVYPMYTEGAITGLCAGGNGSLINGVVFTIPPQATCFDSTLQSGACFEVPNLVPWFIYESDPTAPLTLRYTDSDGTTYDIDLGQQNGPEGPPPNNSFCS